MKEHPILFSTDMVRAILNGRKTQTRRLAKLPLTATLGEAKISPPPYMPGDILWVRETWNLADPDSESALPGEHYGPYAPFTGSQGSRQIRWRAIYRASALSDNHPKYGKALWKPSIHMPRWACRLFLEVVDVGIFKLQDITEEDAVAEGVKPTYNVAETPYKASFHTLWNSLYRSGEICWEANPWVWAIKFHVLEMKT